MWNQSRPQDSFPGSPLPDWSGRPFSTLDPYVRPWTLAVAAPDRLCAARKTCAMCLTAEYGDQVVWAAPKNGSLGGGVVALMDVGEFACYQTYAQYAAAAAGAGASAVLIYYTDREARCAAAWLMRLGDPSRRCERNGARHMCGVNRMNSSAACPAPAADRV